MTMHTEHNDIPSDKITDGILVLPRKMQMLIVVGIVLLLGTGMSVAHFMGGAPEANTVQAPPPGTFRPTKEQLASLGVAPVQVMNFRSEQITDGAIAYNDDTTTQVFSPYSGRVTRVIAQLGEVVKKGDPLMAVAASEFVQAKNNLITARAQVTLTTASEKRQHELYLAKAGALKDWLQSQADLATAEGNLQAARNQLSILGKTEHEISAIENGAKVSETNPEALVRAPVSGTVTQRQVGLGQFLQSASGGATIPVYTIGNLSTVYLIANVREGDAPLMRVGQPVEVHVLALPERVFKAKLSWVAPALDPNTHRLLVRAEIANSDGALKPMMFANFSIITGSDDASPSIGVPQSAVVYEGSEAHVFVENNDGTLVIRPIRIGRISGEMLEVISGLTAGEKIITRGSLFIDRATEGN
jgi:cobalt-zinc-cadmium efflux system membrane fusion protein